MTSEEREVCSSSVKQFCEAFPIVQKWSENTQRDTGDCLLPSQVSVLLEDPYVDFTQNDLSELNSLWGQFRDSERVTFRQTYGHMVDLLSVNIEVPVLQAIVRFWDPSYRCFSFNQLDLIPTIEEYSVLMKIKLQRPDKVYMWRFATNSRKKLAKILGVRAETVGPHFQQKGGSLCVPWQYLRDFINGHLHDEFGLAAFALAIYGLVIFPRVLGYIEASVIDCFEQIQHNVNPAIPILAETIKELNFCRQNSGKRFKGCAPLLYVWIRSHFHCQKSSFVLPHFRDAAPINEFCKSEWFAPKSESWWVSFLYSLGPELVQWTAPWMPRVPILYRCGKDLSVPLLGLSSAVSYIPLLVIRQFGGKQFIPVTAELGDSDFDYKQLCDEKRVDRIVEVWKQTKRFRLGNSVITTTSDYFVWRSERVSNNIPIPKQMIVPIIIQLADQNVQEKVEVEEDIWKKEAKRLREKAEKWEFEAQLHRHKLLKVSKERDTVEKDVKELNEENKKLQLELTKYKKGKAPMVRQGFDHQLRRELEQWKQKASKAQQEAIQWRTLHESSTSRVNGHLEEIERQRSDILVERARLMTAEEEKASMRRQIQVLKEQLEQQQHRHKKIESSWRQEHQQAMQSASQWQTEAQKCQQGCIHYICQIQKAMVEAERMEEKARELLGIYPPTGDHGQALVGFLEEAIEQYKQLMHFFKEKK